MAKNFDELLPKERSFTIRGETFTFQDVSPDVLSAFEVSPNGSGKTEEETVWQLMDRQISLFLPAAEQKRWKTLRARKTDPVTIQQITELLKWLMETQTGLPTEPPSPSAAGRGRTAGSSRAA